MCTMYVYIGVKDLWCSSTIRLLSRQIWINAEAPSILSSCMYTHTHTRAQVLERITKLNLSHNRLQSLQGVQAFVGVVTLQVSYNLLASRADLDLLVELRRLNNLTLAGNSRDKRAVFAPYLARNLDLFPPGLCYNFRALCTRVCVCEYTGKSLEWRGAALK